MNLQVFVQDSPQEKLQVLKNHQKAKIWGCWKNVSFLFILHWKIQWFDQFLVLSGRGRSKLPITTENKAKF